MNDWQLLKTYADRNSESAFRTLVDRHIGLVHASALRQVNDPHLAEDVTQAVFILLARKAATFRREVVLPSWLFRTSRFVARQVLRTERRRQRREQKAFEMHELNSSEAAAPHLAPILDEGLARLGEKDRSALLLRFAEDRSLDEVGARLGVSEEAAKKRVHRALEKLRGFFGRRGITLPTTVLAGVLGDQLAPAAPASLAFRVTTKATAIASATAPALPTLVRQTLDAWRWARLKLAAGLGGVGVVALFVMTSLLPTVPDTDDSAASDPDVRVSGSGGETTVTTSSAAGASIPEGRILQLYVVSEETDEPVPYAGITLQTVVDGRWEQRFDLRTDDGGLARITYPAHTTRLDVGAFSPGRAARFVTWRVHRNDPVPAEYTLRLDATTDRAGGWLRDEEGQPIADAEIVAKWSTGDVASRETPRERVGLPRQTVLIRTDVQGRWDCAVISRKEPGRFYLEARHADFATTSIASYYGSKAEAGPEKTAWQDLWAGKLVTRMERAGILSGRVLDAEGSPVVGAKLIHSPGSFESLSVETGDEGYFVFPKLDPGAFDFTVTAAGFAPEYRKVNIQPKPTPMEIRLQPGAILRLRLIGEYGTEVSGATVGLEQWGKLRHKLDWQAQSDSAGRVEWTSAPPEEELVLYARKQDWCYTRNIRVRADGTEHVIRMHSAMWLSGRVTDADTGEPIPEVKAFPGYGDGEYMWERLSTRRGKDGLYSVLFQETKTPWRVRVEAEGYQPFISDPVSPNSVGALDVTLQRLDASAGVRGIVLGPDGEPAPATRIVLLTLNKSARLDGEHLRSEIGNDPVHQTNTDGSFSFGPETSAHTLVAAGEAGFARLRLGDTREPLTVRLQPWGRIEGLLHDSVFALPVESVRVAEPSRIGYQGRLIFDRDSYSAVPDPAGRFVLEHVPPIRICVSINPGVDKVAYHHRTYLEVLPGETTEVLIAERTWQVKGRLVTTSREVPDWADPGIRAELRPTPFGLRVPENLTGDAAKLWLVDYWTSEAGWQHAIQGRGARLNVAADGTFVSERPVDPGEYTLQVRFPDRPTWGEPATVPPADHLGTVVFDLGEIPIPALGQTQVSN